MVRATETGLEHKMTEDLASLLDYVTPGQAKVIEAIIKANGNISEASRSMGINRSSVQLQLARAKVRAALAGHAPGHFDDGVAPGYRMGKVTIQRGPGGVERVWERQHPDDQRRQEGLREFVEGLLETGARGASEVVKPPSGTNADLLTAYLFGDPHFGMRAMAAEAGEDFDLAEAERITCAAIDYMVGRAPPSETGLLVNIGDYFHADDSTNQTPAHKNPLDVDGRFFHITQAGLRALVYSINRMKVRHSKVIVWILPGNHDPHTAWMLALCLSSFFDNDPRVVIDMDPGLYKYLRFGRNLLGAHHGHGAKLTDLPLIMANDRKEDWGQTDHRVFWMGHIHHKQVQEVHGVFVESLNTLAPGDAWHRGKGYRSTRSSQMVVLDANHGETERHKCNASILRKAA